MDTTKKYIKMCEKAEEIQQERVYLDLFQEGDYFDYQSTTPHEIMIFYKQCQEEFNQFEFLSEYYNQQPPIRNPWYYVFLPRQDQLQGMVKSCNWTLDRKPKLEKKYLFSVEKFISVRSVRKTAKAFLGDTSEQATIQGVMWSNYDKIWSEEKEEWIKEK